MSLKYSRKYSWVGNSQTGQKVDRASKAAAIALLRKRGFGQVWTSDGEHLVAWFNETGKLCIHPVSR